MSVSDVEPIGPAETDAIMGLAQCQVTPLAPGDPVTEEWVAQVETRARYIQRYRGVVSRAISGRWSVRDTTIHVGGMRAAVFPIRSAGEQRRSPILARLFAYLGNNRTEDDVLTLCTAWRQLAQKIPRRPDGSRGP